jgi:carbon storage regulator
MLVLTRKRGEELILPDLGVTIQLVDVRGDKVRLGISAPPQIAVFRKEVLDRMRERERAEFAGAGAAATAQ